MSLGLPDRSKNARRKLVPTSISFIKVDQRKVTHSRKYMQSKWIRADQHYLSFN